MFFDGENKTFNMEFILNYVLVKDMPISAQNYKTISLVGLAL